MNPVDQMVPKREITERQLDGAAAGPDDRLDEQLRVSVEALLHPSPPPKPVMELDDLLLAITHHLDEEASERKAIYNRLLAIEDEVKRRGSRGFAGYVAAICIAAAAILASQSYGEATKQIIATSAPKLGWSPEAKQVIASWVQQLGWTKPAVRPPAPLSVTSTSKGAAPSPDPQQVQQIETDIAAVRQAVERHLSDMRETIERLTAGQDEIVREINKLQAADEEILGKIPTPPPKHPAPARKPAPIAPSPSRAPIPPRLLPHP
jgi:hypothetical protein